MVYFCCFYHIFNIYVNLNKQIWHMSKEYGNSFTFLYLHTPFALARNIYVASNFKTILETKYNK